MIIGVGTDVVEVARLEASLERTPTLRDRLFTPAEAALPLESLAARFAAKEALAKALGAPGDLSWQDAEVVTDVSGWPSFELRGQRRRPRRAAGRRAGAPLPVPRRRRGRGVRRAGVMRWRSRPSASRPTAPSTTCWWCCSLAGAVGIVLLGRRHRGTVAGSTFQQGARGRDPVRHRAEPDLPAHAGRLRPRHLAAAGVVRPRLDDGGVGAVDPPAPAGVADLLLGADAHHPGHPHARRSGQIFPDPRWFAFWACTSWSSGRRSTSPSDSDIGPTLAHLPRQRWSSPPCGLSWSTSSTSSSTSTTATWCASRASGSLLDLFGPWPLYVFVSLGILVGGWALLTWPWQRRTAAGTGFPG